MIPVSYTHLDVYKRQAAESVEDVVIRKLAVDKLHTALMQLTREERDFISALFFDEKTESEVAKGLGCLLYTSHPFRRKKSLSDGRIQACSSDGIRCEDWRRTFCRCVDTGAGCPRQAHKCMSDRFPCSRCGCHLVLYPLFYFIFIAAANYFLRR